jgi:hypothetical protein
MEWPIVTPAELNRDLALHADPLIMIVLAAHVPAPNHPVEGIPV